MSARTAFGAVLLSLLVCAAALAQERKIYKYVDEKGNVVYSQTPPTDASKARKIDVSPAYRGRGGNNPSGSPYDNPRTYSGDEYQQQYRNALREREQQSEEARRNRLAELEAECNRNRGADCKDPQALRYQESTQIPRGRR